MKNRKTGLFCWFAGGALMIVAAVLIIAYFAIKSDTEEAITVLLVIGFLLLAVSLVMMVIGYRMAFVASKGQKSEWDKYLSYPHGKITDYKKELEEMRTKFANDINPQKNVFSKRTFIGAEPLYDFNVIKNGKIYYAYVVDASPAIAVNTNLASSVLPATVVYSTDEYYEENPLDLKRIAKKISAGRALKAEGSWDVRVRIKDAPQDGRELIISSVMVYRNHLPTGCLSDGLVPVIANPATSTSVFVADFRYWTDNFIGNFANGLFNKAQPADSDPFSV